MGWQEVWTDIETMLDYQNREDWIMAGFYYGDVTLGTPILAIENYNFFAEIWNWYEVPLTNLKKQK